MISRFIPERLTRAAGRATLKASANSPKYLFVAGVVGAVGATVLACRATLRVEDILIDHQKVMLDIKTVNHVGYAEKDRQHDKLVLFTRTSIKLVTLYGPSVIVGGLSIAALTKSHNLLQARNAGLTAAYTGLLTTMDNYRDRVKKEIGEEKENKIWHDVQVIEEIGEDGKKHKREIVGPNGGSQYAKFYDQDNRNFVVGSPEANIMVLRSRENYLNDRLRMRGFLFLNEAYEELGFDWTSEGQDVGWLFLPEDPNYRGDSAVDLGIWGDSARESLADFVIYGDGIFLDFNVDGPIKNKLNRVKPLWKLTDKAQRRARRS